jgi:HEPN domain-containing protein
MTEGSIDIERVINYWKDTSDKDYQTMCNLLNSGDYNWAMFLGHLVVEKLPKAAYVKVYRRHAIHGHDLLRLTSGLGLDLDPIKQ